MNRSLARVVPRVKKLILGTAAIIVLWTSSSMQESRAQFVVLDPANLVENIISALQNTETVLNQITQLSHEVQSLAYQAQNLEQMSPTLAANVLTQYTAQFGKLATAMQAINGIAQNVAQLTSRYNATYPNTMLGQGPLSTAYIMAQLTNWLNQSRSVYQGAYNTQAQVLASLPADTSNVQMLLQTSSSAAGALGAIQAGNQLQGQLASQLQKINAQMVTTNQAQLNWIAQQSQFIAQAQVLSQAQGQGFTAPSTATPNLIYDAFH